MSGTLPLRKTNRSGHQNHFWAKTAACESLVTNKEGNDIIADDVIDWAGNEYCRGRVRKLKAEHERKAGGRRVAFVNTTYVQFRVPISEFGNTWIVCFLSFKSGML